MDVSKLELKFEINGYKVFSDPNLLVDEEEVIELSWRERLFSWPWRPWKSTYVVKMKVANPKVFKDGSNLIAHPYTVSLMADEIVNTVGLSEKNS